MDYLLHPARGLAGARSTIARLTTANRAASRPDFGRPDCGACSGSLSGVRSAAYRIRRSGMSMCICGWNRSMAGKAHRPLKAAVGGTGDAITMVGQCHLPHRPLKAAVGGTGDAITMVGQCHLPSTKARFSFNNGLLLFTKGLLCFRRSLCSSRRGLLSSRRSLFCSTKGLLCFARALFSFRRGLFSSRRSLFSLRRGLLCFTKAIFCSARGLFQDQKARFGPT